jgi:nicotinamide mononucleotide transporter
MLAPLFNFFTHLYGIFYWSKNTDGDGNMIPKSANKIVWLVTIAFIAIGLALFPTVNNWLAQWVQPLKVENKIQKPNIIQNSSLQ